MGGGGVTGTPGTLPSCALPPVLWCCVVYTNKTYSTDGLHVKIFANHRPSQKFSPKIPLNQLQHILFRPVT